MAPFIGIIVTLCGLTGTHGITTVSTVSVKVGATVSIPCLYEPSHKNRVKYLCKGYYWSTCSYVILTNSKSSSPEDLYTISDDPDQGIFTVTITSQEMGTQTYWCAVDISGPDEKTYFQLLVSKGMSSLYVDQQEITGFEGDSIVIRFRCIKQVKEEIGWCKLGHQQNGCIDGSQVFIDTCKQDVFVVTMSHLHMESSGWYMCFQGQLTMPIHLTVAISTTTMNTTTSRTVGTLSEDVSTKNITDKENGPSEMQSSNLKYLLISFGILLFIILVALLVWWMFHRQAKSKRTAITGSSETEIVYSNVMPMHSSAAQNVRTDYMNQRQTPEDDENVTYSVIVTKPRQL